MNKFKEPLKVFSLPEEMLQDITFKNTSINLKSEKILHDNCDINKEVQEQLSNTSITTINTATAKSFSCLVCGITDFEDGEQQRTHFKLDWHRYNVKRHVKYLEAGKFKNYQPISEQNFEEIMNDSMSSISGSDTELEDEEEIDEDNGAITLKPQKQQSQHKEPRYWTMIMLMGGHFAGSIFVDLYYSSKKSSSEPVTLSFSKYDPLSNKSINLIPPLLILHGLFGSKQNWKSLAKMFAQSLNTSVYALDLRNHGDSPHSSIVNYEIMSDDVAKFITDHKLNQAIIMGHSMGGKVAMAMALRQVPQVERLIVVDASPTNVRISDEFAFYIDTMKKVENVGVIKQSKADEIMQDYISNPSIRHFLLTNLKKDPDTGLYKFRIPLNILDDSLIYPTIETFFPNSIIAEFMLRNLWSLQIS
ncbi:14393_t:CDS:2 [Entrophospora sp. SA101]|nr:14393_t:CDS:2 [Entrophospora sp. SA101]CAJ0826058.1 6586_t:CDS:2 [Entrophospora sp. SA101]